MDEAKPTHIPLGVLALDIAGTLMLAFGITGSLGILDGFTTMFADRSTGYVFVALGIVLIATAIPGLVRWSKEMQRQRGIQ